MRAAAQNRLCVLSGVNRKIMDTYIAPDPKSTLRDYQIKAVDDIEQATGNVLFVLPTGAGKTVVAAKIIENQVAQGRRSLILTHRREILQQTSLKLSAIDVGHGLIQAGLNCDLEYPVQVASIQTLWARCMRANKIPLPGANTIIIDEAHHVRARTWEIILRQYPNAKRIGLTATPCRGDGRGLGNYFDTLIEGPQIPELIREKHLVPTIYYAPTEPNLKGVEVRQGDYAINQLAARMNRDDLVGDIVSHWHRHSERRRSIVFCVDVAHSLHVCSEFRKSGVNAEHLDGSTPLHDRNAILERLRSGATEVVTNCQVLTEGFDAPNVSCIVLARPTKQLGLFRQMAGRGLRPAENKANLKLLDHSGAVFRHGLLEDRITWTLDIDRQATNTEHINRTKQQIRNRLIECSQCSAMRTPGQPCPSCGFLPHRPAEAIVFREGNLAQLNSKSLRAINEFSPEEKQGWLEQLTYIGITRGYKMPGWANCKYKEKFGYWPPYGMTVRPRAPSMEVSSWVRSRNIAWAKSHRRAAS